MKNLTLVFLYFLVIINTQAQTCGNDDTFNPNDNSLNVLPALAGADVLIQNDGKILVIDDRFHSIIRYNSDGSLDIPFFNNIKPTNNSVINFSWYIHTIAIQDDGKILVGGEFTSYGPLISRNRIARLNADGSLDNTFNPVFGGNSPHSVKSIVIQDDGKILVAGIFSSATYSITRLNVDGSLDNTFNIGTEYRNFTGINSIAKQSDGKIIISGNFFRLADGFTSSILRLNADGSLDNTFNITTGFNSIVNALTIQNDGKILAGGLFTQYNGNSCNGLARLNADGSFDNTFNIGTGFSLTSSNANIYNITIQNDSKILIGGDFTHYNGNTHNRIVRLNANGFVDNTFNTGIGFNGIVGGIGIQGNGKIIARGTFTSYNANIFNYLVQLNTDGSVDNTIKLGTGFNSRVSILTTQNDGKILIGGLFSQYSNNLCQNVARLNADGTFDNTFNIGTGFRHSFSGVSIYAITIQADGKILIGGYFTQYNGNSCNNLARLNADGTFDNTFNIGAGFNGPIFAITIQNDGKILVGGNFTEVSNNSFNGLARLNSNGTLDGFFSPTTGLLIKPVYTIAIQADGKILAGGGYDGLATRKGIVRLNMNGGFDNTFNIGTGFNGAVFAINTQNDSKILAGGNFTNYNGNSCGNIARLNTDGTFDNTFINIGTTFGGDIKTISVQRDGKIFVGGDFINSNGKGGIARLHSNGTIDSTFNIWVNNRNNIYTSHLQNNGKLLVGGEFMIYGGIVRNHIARFDISCSTMNIVGPNTLPNATIGVAYSQNFTQTSSSSIVTWSATGLPDGLSIDPNTGTLSGTPTAIGTNTVTIIVTDINGNRVSQVYILIVENDSIEANKIELVKLYPNPTLNKIKIETKNQIIDFQVYNSLGQRQKTVWKNVGESIEVDMLYLPQGIYYFHINTTDGIAIRCLNKL